MRTPRRTTAIILTGAVVLASGAYAIGTQAGGGSADARDSRAGAPPFPPGEPFDALADALGKSTEEVEKALEQRHEAEQSAFAKRLAAALDLDPADVEAALEKVMDGAGRGGPQPPGDFIDDLVSELGVSTDRLEDALREVRPPGRHADCGGPGPVGPDVSGLAAALGVTPAELRSALRDMWNDRRSDRADDSGELAEFLAKRFNLSVDRVEKALDDTFPPPPEPGLRGGPGPGFGPPAWHD